MHENLNEDFKKSPELPASINPIKEKILKLKSDECLWIARWYLLVKKNLEESKKMILKALESNPNNYGVYLIKAIIDFSFENDPILALKTIHKARDRAGMIREWIYSEAFLYFWLENYDKALKVCKKITKNTFNGEDKTTEDVRKFNIDLLDENPKKYQLYFWIGFISYKKDHNLANALNDFEKFINNAPDQMQILINKAKSYLSEIKKEMEIKN